MLTKRVDVVSLSPLKAPEASRTTKRAKTIPAAIFEASDRLGGRILSVIFPGFSSHAVEIGAFRLLSTDAIALKLLRTSSARAHVPISITRAIGSDPEAVMAYLREPFPSLHVCGEAWSLHQGWIKGAFDTAEAMLQEKFGLRPLV